MTRLAATNLCRPNGYLMTAARARAYATLSATTRLSQEASFTNSKQLGRVAAGRYSNTKSPSAFLYLLHVPFSKEQANVPPARGRTGQESKKAIHDRRESVLKNLTL